MEFDWQPVWLTLQLAAVTTLILLLLGGFMISEAMADSGAHRRVALYLVNLFGEQAVFLLRT